MFPTLPPSQETSNRHSPIPSLPNELWLENIFNECSLQDLLRLRTNNPRSEALVDAFLTKRYRLQNKSMADFSTFIPSDEGGYMFIWWNGIPYRNNVFDEQAYKLSSLSDITVIESDTRDAIFYVDKKNNVVYASGINSHGQLGFESQNHIAVVEPRIINTLNGIKIETIVSHHNSTFFIIGGSVLACGRNLNGKLGLGGGNREQKILWPLAVAIPAGHHIINVFGDASRTFFLTREGRVLACGCNREGERGVGEIGSIVREPRLITALNGIVITKVICSGSSTFFIANDGRVFACGNNDCSQLGLSFGQDAKVLTPQEITALRGIVVQNVICDPLGQCNFFIDVNGRVFANGDNTSKRLGLNHSGSSSRYPAELTLFNHIAIKDVALVGNSTFFSTKDGRILACGDNSNGRLHIASTEETVAIHQQVFINGSPAIKMLYYKAQGAVLLITQSGIMRFVPREGDCEDISRKNTMRNPWTLSTLSQNVCYSQFENFMQDKAIGYIRTKSDMASQWCEKKNDDDGCQYAPIYFDGTFLYATMRYLEPNDFSALLNKFKNNSQQSLLQSILKNAVDGRFIIYAARYQSVENFRLILLYSPKNITPFEKFFYGFMENIQSAKLSLFLDHIDSICERQVGCILRKNPQLIVRARTEFSATVHNQLLLLLTKG